MADGLIQQIKITRDSTYQKLFKWKETWLGNASPMKEDDENGKWSGSCCGCNTGSGQRGGSNAANKRQMRDRMSKTKFDIQKQNDEVAGITYTHLRFIPTTWLW